MKNAMSTGAHGHSAIDALHTLTQQQETALIFIGAGALGMLWLRARWSRRRLRRSYGRAMRRTGVGRQLRGMRRNRVLAKAGATRRATLAFRKAAVASVAVAALLVWAQVNAGR